jgi:hypothetical protein
MNPNIHTENIDEDGEVIFDEESNLPFVAVYYQPCLGIRAANGYLRVFSDADGHHTETRIDHAALIAAGWSQREAAGTADEKPDGQAENSNSTTNP